MVRTEYSAVRNVEVRGFFVSSVQVFLVLFLLLSLVIALIVVAALLVHEKGKAKHAGVVNGDLKESGKQDIQSVESILDYRHFNTTTLNNNIRGGMSSFICSTEFDWMLRYTTDVR